MADGPPRRAAPRPPGPGNPFGGEPSDPARDQGADPFAGLPAGELLNGGGGGPGGAGASVGGGTGDGDSVGAAGADTSFGASSGGFGATPSPELAAPNPAGPSAGGGEGGGWAAFGGPPGPPPPNQLEQDAFLQSDMELAEQRKREREAEAVQRREELNRAAREETTAWVEADVEASPTPQALNLAKKTPLPESAADADGSAVAAAERSRSRGESAESEAGGGHRVGRRRRDDVDPDQGGGGGGQGGGGGRVLRGRGRRGAHELSRAALPHGGAPGAEADVGEEERGDEGGREWGEEGVDVRVEEVRVGGWGLGGGRGDEGREEEWGRRGLGRWRERGDPWDGQVSGGLAWGVGERREVTGKGGG